MLIMRGPDPTTIQFWFVFQLSKHAILDEETIIISSCILLTKLYVIHNVNIKIQTVVQCNMHTNGWCSDDKFSNTHNMFSTKYTELH